VKWVLVFIYTKSLIPEIGWYGDYDTMTQCFEEREKLVEAVGRPIVNYQFVCVQTERKDVKNPNS